MKTALLLSGGMDSIALAFWKHPDSAITVDYGQLSAGAEINAASAVSSELRIAHYVIKADMSSLGTGDMVGKPQVDVAPVSEWWPFRNQMLITLAAMKAIHLGVNHLIIGTLKSDEAHADGRDEFIGAMNAVLRMQEGGITLGAPAIGMGAAELIQVSGVPLEILAWAHSCHVAEHACGMCRGCRKHYETLEELGVQPY
jgi:7-cyano-7-deazaguanine synthase